MQYWVMFPRNENPGNGCTGKIDWARTPNFRLPAPEISRNDWPLLLLADDGGQGRLGMSRALTISEPSQGLTRGGQWQSLLPEVLLSMNVPVTGGSGIPPSSKNTVAVTPSRPMPSPSSWPLPELTSMTCAPKRNRSPGAKPSSPPKGKKSIVSIEGVPTVGVN